MMFDMYELITKVMLKCGDIKKNKTTKPKSNSKKGQPLHEVPLQLLLIDGLDSRFYH